MPPRRINSPCVVNHQRMSHSGGIKLYLLQGSTQQRGFGDSYIYLELNVVRDNPYSKTRNFRVIKRVSFPPLPSGI